MLRYEDGQNCLNDKKGSVTVFMQNSQNVTLFTNENS